jgi:hypothetical protein
VYHAVDESENNFAIKVINRTRLKRKMIGPKTSMFDKIDKELEII